MCRNSCTICPNLVISTAVTVVTIDTVPTLVVDIPAGTYQNDRRLCLVIAQTVPTTATIAMPVAISIGGDTTTVYPMVRCDCAQVTASNIRTRTRYPLKVSTTATGGVFKVLRNLSCGPDNALAAIPSPAAAAPTGITL